MAEPVSLTKFFSGMITGAHWAKTLSFSLSALFLVFIGFGVYRGYFKKPLPSTEQYADKIENHYHQPRVTFGCASTRVYQKYPVNGVK